MYLTYGITCWGGTYKSKLQRIFNLQKRCVRILFGEIYSFDHPEYYSTCARAKTFTEHMAQKDYALEHTKPIFNKYNLLNLHNLYVIRSLVELFKILKFHSPIPILEYFKASTRSSNHRLQIPKFNLGISEKNYVISVTKLWNTSIGKLLDCPTLSVRPFTNGCQFIISGSTKNSDLTIPVGLFKKDLKIY